MSRKMLHRVDCAREPQRKVRKVQSMEDTEHPGTLSVLCASTEQHLLQDAETVNLLTMFCGIVVDPHSGHYETYRVTPNSFSLVPPKQVHTSRDTYETSACEPYDEIVQRKLLPEGHACPPRRFYRSFWRSLTRKALYQMKATKS